jgi:glycosyltransferase involved in cell wall biosynthesis
VVPVYNESEHLSATIKVIDNALLDLGQPYELVLVDDGSIDNTWQVIEQEKANYPNLRALRLSRNFGKESALSAGLEAANGKAVIIMDGDLQHPPTLLPEMAKLWSESGIDLVEAVKRERGKESMGARFGANLFYWLLKMLSGHDLNDATDFKLLDRKVVDAWLKLGEKNLFFRGMIAWLGFERERVLFEVPERAGGQTKWSFFRKLGLALDGLLSFSTLPIHLITVLGVSFLIFAFGLGIQTLVMFFSGHAVGGFTTVILLLLIIGGLIMSCLGIMGAYIAKIYIEVKGRPRYIVSEKIENVDQ